MTPPAYSILLFGASGRMGHEIIAAVERRCAAGQELSIRVGIAGAADPLINRTVSGIEQPLAAAWSPEQPRCDVIIDFSSPEGAVHAAAVARKQRIPLLACSTGLNEAQEAEVQSVAAAAPLIRTRNTSIGVTVLARLVAEAAKLLPESFDIELSEIHHRYKADAPSGTALLLLEEAAAARGTALAERLHAGRAGGPLQRKAGEIGAHAVRGGDVAGEHTVYFLSDGERIELTHRASSRRIFADGALLAADWLVAHARSGKPPGSFTMQHVVGMVST